MLWSGEPLATHMPNMYLNETISTHRRQGKVSAISWSSHDGLKMDAETPSACSIFQAENKERASAAYTGSRVSSDILSQHPFG